MRKYVYYNKEWMNIKSDEVIWDVNLNQININSYGYACIA